MKNISIRRYHNKDFALWNQWVAQAKNATFLFHRDFIEYHKGRFEDYSLMLFSDEKLLAILPAHRAEKSVFSHQGLTYGGLVVNEKLRSTDFFTLFEKLLIFLHKEGINELYIKGFPHFYTTQFADEIKYLQFVLGAEIYRKDFCAVIHLAAPYDISASVIRDRKKALQNGYQIDFDGDISLFWEEVLIPNLQETFQCNPVHSVEEILYLKEKFPQHIQQVNVLSEKGEIIGGTTLFIDKKTVHSQYISMKKKLLTRGVLDHLHCSILEKIESDFSYFDFGISNEEEGKKINKGLLEWKEKFGARPAIQEFYKFHTYPDPQLNNLYV